MRIGNYEKDFISISCLSLGFASCSSDDDNDNNEDNEKFIWNGDWNSPTDPNYKPNGYCPIAGKWKSVKSGAILEYYLENGKCYQKRYDSDGKGWIEDCLINDKALRANSTGIILYKVVDENLWMNQNHNDQNSEWSKID